MNELTRIKLRRVAKIFTEQDIFPDETAALQRLELDYPKGYPNDRFINALLNAVDAGRPVVVHLDAAGNYGYLTPKAAP